MVLAELQRLPVGYLDDVMLYQEFAQAWTTFKGEKDKEALLKQHPVYQTCMEIWMDQNGEKLKQWKARKKKQ